MDLILLIWLVVFVAGSAMDVYTTWLCITLPEEYKSKELNPFFAKNTRERFKSILGLRIIVTAGLVGLSLVSEGSLFLPTKVLTILTWLVVTNNSYIYIAKRIRRRLVWTPGRFLTETLDLPSSVAYFSLITILLGLAYLLAIRI